MNLVPAAAAVNPHRGAVRGHSVYDCMGIFDRRRHAMADNSTPEVSNEDLRAAVSESVEEGIEIRERVRDLTLQAIRSRRLDPEEVRQIMQAATEGVTLGLEGRGADMRG